MNNLEPRSRVRRAYFALAIAIVGWGLSAPLIEAGLSHFTPLLFLTYRFLLVTLILTPYVVVYRREAFQLFKNKYIWIIGLSEAIALILQYIAQQQVPAGLTTLLIMLTLLIVPFLSVYLLEERLKGQYLLSVGIGLLGILLISSEGDISGLLSGSVSISGVLLLIGAACGYAFYLVFTSKFRQFDNPNVDTFNLFYVVIVVITLLSGVMTMFTERVDIPTPEGLLWVCVLAIFSTLITFLAYFEAMKEIPANLVSVLLLLQIIIAFAIDILFIKRQYNVWVYIGAVIILIAMIIAILVPKDVHNTQNKGRERIIEEQ